MGMQRTLDLIYPHQCVLCDTLVEMGSGLCGPCWRDTPFIMGVSCDSCGAPLMGEDDGYAVQCDDCMETPRPWDRGRSAVVYRDRGRHLVLALKHGDRQDIVAPAARWMLRAAGPLIAPGSLLVPVPIHWMRMWRRRFNQASLLATAIGREARVQVSPRALVRLHATEKQDGKSPDARFANMQNAIAPHPKYGALMEGRDVVLIDDVMTSGATLAACAAACTDAGATRIDVVTLARVARDT